MPDKVAIYIRVSTQEQAKEGYSIEAQTDRLTAYCKARDWPIADIYSDPGFSGANTQRPALQRLFADIEEKLVDCVLVYKLDRLSRSQKDTLYMIEDVFLANGIEFVSMQENFDTSSPFGRATIGMLSVFAQLEREQIRERLMMGRTERAKTGLFHGGGFHPFGYDYINGRLVINKANAIIIREVYDLFLDNTPMNRIETILEKKYGRTINHTLIRSILSTPIYTGVITWAGQTYPGQHEPIIDEEDFEQAQELLNDRRRLYENKPLPFRPTHLLTGLLMCGNCGAGYFARSNRSRSGKMLSYYCCYSRAKTIGRKIIDITCKNPTYRVDELDAQVLAEVERLVNDEEYFESVIGEKTITDTSRIEDDRRTLMQKIDALDLQISRVIDLYQLGSLNIGDIGERTQKLQREKAALQQTLNTMKVPKDTTLSPEEAHDILSQFYDVLNGGDISAKREMLQALIKKIVVKPTRYDFDIVWNL